METTLYFKQGSSDKVYQTQVVPEGSGFVVNFQYGRRGGTLAAGTKTKSPVSEAEAIKVFNKLVNEKQAKGYTSGEAGTPYVATSNEERVTGLHVQLLNPIDETDVESFITNSQYGLQEKFDGKRMMLKYETGEVSAINRKGLTCGAPKEILESFEALVGDIGNGKTVIDGELVGNTFYTFDILFFGGDDITGEAYMNRQEKLHILVGEWKDIMFVASAFTEQEKRNFFTKMRDQNREGVVFKDRNAPYVAGRPSSGGTQFKFKFQSEATCVVTAVHPSKRSFSVGVGSGVNSIIEVGNCTIPANKEFPTVGQMVEIRYLYAFPDGGSLYQPFFKGIRDDKDYPDAYSSLKFKPE